MRIPDYPAPTVALDGTELLPIWGGGQQRSIPIQLLWSLAAEQNPAFKGSSSGWMLTPLSRLALAAVSSPTNKQSAYVAEVGYAGVFVFSTANLSTQVTADKLIDSGGWNYVAPASDTTGASGAWVRAGALMPMAVPAFTNASYFSGAQHLQNGAVPGSMYSTAFVGNYATEALTAGIIVPSGATNLQTNGIASYIRSDRAQYSGGGDVGIFTLALANATGSAVFPINIVGEDSSGHTGQIISTELDYNVSAADTIVNGVNATIVSTSGGSLTGTRIAFAARGVFHAASQWSIGFLTSDGAIAQYAMSVGAVSTTASTNRDSQSIAFTAYDASNNRYISSILGDHTAGLTLRAGGPLGSIAFQSQDGSANWGSVSTQGMGYPINSGTGGVITQLTSRTTAVTINKVCGQITLFSAPGSASWQTFTVNNSMVAATDTLRVTQQSGTDKYQILITRTASGAFDITFATTGGTTTEQPVFNFAIIKGANN